jgi:hypothetical protein
MVIRQTGALLRLHVFERMIMWIRTDRINTTTAAKPAGAALMQASHGKTVLVAPMNDAPDANHGITD